jgi:mannose-6-phosphate isomerase-like protein (cupin superfamily)
MSERRRVEKPWGHEIIWAVTERYVGKILHIRAGEALSLQYHRKKDESIYLAQGDLILETGVGDQPTERKVLKRGDSLHIPPGLRHRMIAVSDCDVFEVSTPELDDVVRLEDRYGRVPR